MFNLDPEEYNAIVQYARLVSEYEYNQLPDPKDPNWLALRNEELLLDCLKSEIDDNYWRIPENRERLIYECYQNGIASPRLVDLDLLDCLNGHASYLLRYFSYHQRYIIYYLAQGFSHSKIAKLMFLNSFQLRQELLIIHMLYSTRIKDTRYYYAIAKNKLHKISKSFKKSKISYCFRFCALDRGLRVIKNALNNCEFLELGELHGGVFDEDSPFLAKPASVTKTS